MINIMIADKLKPTITRHLNEVMKAEHTEKRAWDNVKITQSYFRFFYMYIIVKCFFKNKK
jgi:hypothetical protein